MGGRMKRSLLHFDPYVSEEVKKREFQETLEAYPWLAEIHSSGARYDRAVIRFTLGGSFDFENATAELWAVTHWFGAQPVVSAPNQGLRSSIADLVMADTPYIVALEDRIRESGRCTFTVYNGPELITLARIPPPRIRGGDLGGAIEEDDEPDM